MGFLVLGVVAGVAITLNVLDLALAVAGGVGAVLASRFKDWAAIILAGLTGAVLAMRGISTLLPGLGGLLATSLALLLTSTDIAYQGGLFRRLNPQPREYAELPDDTRTENRRRSCVRGCADHLPALRYRYDRRLDRQIQRR